MSQQQIGKSLADGTLARVLQSEQSAFAIKTWDPKLARDDRLLVPVDVRALVVGATAKVGHVPTVTTMPSEAGSWPVAPAPFAGETARAPGVYLHVAMPDGLTRGLRRDVTATLPAGNPMALPPLPDRVLVVRMLHHSSKRRAWILLADSAAKRDLEGYTAAPPATQPLTAVSGGDAAWAATWDAVENRYALYDDLADLSVEERRGRASYFVAAFWSVDASDPLHGLTTQGEFDARIAQLGWFAPPLQKQWVQVSRVNQALRSSTGLAGKPVSGSFPTVDGVTLGTDPSWIHPGDAGVWQMETLVPQKTLLHGSVFGVPFDGTGPDLRPPSEKIDLAVGGSGLAALARMLATGTDHLAQERLLQAFFSQALDRVDSADGIADMDEARHAVGFTALSGGQRERADRVAERHPASPSTTPKTTTLGFGRKPPPAARKKARPGEAATTFRDVTVPLPRYFVANDPAVVIRGGRRSERHGGDGRLSPDGLLHCRLPHEVAKGYSGILDVQGLPFGLRTLGSGALPTECDALMAEAVLTDPYRSDELAAWAHTSTNLPADSLKTRVQAELTLQNLQVKPGTRKSLTLDGAQADQARRASLLDGTAPSPLAGNLWAQPWVPLWLDYALELRLDDGADFELRGVDLEPTVTPTVAPETLNGRVLLTATSASGMASQLRRWLDDEDQRDAAGRGVLAEAEEAQLHTMADAADGMDVLTGAFSALRRHLLGRDDETAAIDAAGNVQGRPQPVALPRLLVGGRMRLARARLVDGFGRTLELPVARLLLAATHDAPDGDILVRPRFTAPARALFRFVDPAPADDAPPVEARVDQQNGSVTPVCGWLLPDHVDEALEVFDQAGEPLGQLMHDPLTGAVVWEGAPGRPGPLGHAPDGGSGAGRHLERFAVGLIAADSLARAAAPAESALSALLRAVDTTLWTVDPFHHFGSGSVAGLVGRPIAVVRATLQLEVASDAGEVADAAARAARQAVFAALAARTVSARVGELTRSDDGLLAYAIDDDYQALRLPAGDVRGRARTLFGAGEAPIRHPYLDAAPEVILQPGQLVRLTLFMVPGAQVSLTTGLLPRKRIALQREWFSGVMDALSPSFRAGPLLIDPEIVRLPKISGLGKNQRFTHKPNALDWRDDPIVAATQTAYLPELPTEVKEGWIRVAAEDGEDAP
jgi:hypothetical protein